MNKKRLGEVLRDRGYVSPADLDKAIQDQQGKLVHLGELMLERGLVTRQDLAGALTEIIHVPYVKCEELEVDPDVLRLISHAMARRCCVLPIQLQGTTKLVVVMAEPQNLLTVDELRFSTGMEIVPRLGFRDEVLLAIEKWYGAAEQGDATLTEVTGPTTEGPALEFISSSSLQRNIEAMQEMHAEMLQESTPAVGLIASTISAAVTKGATDIHIEPQAAGTSVRLRVDGILRDYQQIPRAMQTSVISRIKILSDMDIAERHAPQDGRFLVKVSGRKVDLHVSTLPTQYGEKVVLRLLPADAPMQSFGALGLPAEMISSLDRILAMPQGMLLVAGPVGTGKSTTLYASLAKVKKPGLNIVTVEDPVEFLVPGWNQVQVNTKSGLTFGGCLRSVLGQDPNVIMIGEIQDKETGEIAVKAAQSGHLVLSTLHTNDSVAAITRLSDLGIPGFQIATSIAAIIAQRLVRRLCACHDEIPAAPEYVARLRDTGVAEAPRTQRIPKGCEECGGTGYKGRIGIFEMLVFNEAIRSAIRSGHRDDQVRTVARHNGLKLMHEYALDQVQAGLTTLDEVQRLIPFEIIATAQCPSCNHDLSPAFLFCPFCGERVAEEDEKPKHRRRSLVGHGVERE
jgi:type IV pilus assembly protein PilB